MSRRARVPARLLLVLALALATVVGVSAAPASATSSFGAPRYAVVASYSTNVVEDPADVYYPVSVTPQEFPVAFLMQGALVDKTLYSQYAQKVASYGFIVVVTNNLNVVFGEVGYYQLQTSINEVQVWMSTEDVNPFSPIEGMIDVDTLTLLGHSFGGAASLFAIGNQCQIPFCYGLVYQRPTNLKAAALWGSNTVAPEGRSLPGQPTVAPIDVAGVGTALINGTLDGNATLAETQATYDLMSGGSRALIAVNGANHYGQVNLNNPPGCVPDANSPTIAQATAIETIARWSAMWLLANLGDPEAQSYVFGGAGDRRDQRVSVQLAS